MKQDPHQPKDFFKYFIAFANLLTYLPFILAIVLLDEARPEVKTILDIRRNKNVREVWDMAMVNQALNLLLLSAFIAFLALLIDAYYINHTNRHISVGLLLGLLVPLMFYILISIGF